MRAAVPRGLGRRGGPGAGTHGRPKKLAGPKRLALARRLFQHGQTDVATIFRTPGVFRATLCRPLRQNPSVVE